MTLHIKIRNPFEYDICIKKFRPLSFTLRLKKFIKQIISNILYAKNNKLVSRTDFLQLLKSKLILFQYIKT